MKRLKKNQTAKRCSCGETSTYRSDGWHLETTSCDKEECKSRLRIEEEEMCRRNERTTDADFYSWINL